MQFSSSGKISINSENLQGILNKLKSFKLKPNQKVILLKTYILPKYYHGLVLRRVTLGLLNKLDVIVKKFLKTILHLPADTPNGSFYTPVKSGGMGIPLLKLQIPKVILGRMQSLKNNPDEASTIIYNLPQITSLREKCCHILNIDNITTYSKSTLNSHIHNTICSDFYRTIDGGSFIHTKQHSMGQNWINGHSPFLGDETTLKQLNPNSINFPVKTIVIGVGLL